MMNPSRIEAIQIAREKLAQNPLYLDTETTGVELKSEIVEISIIDDQGQVLLDTLVRPTVSIPADATYIHGITDELVNGLPNWMQVWPQIESVLAGRSVGIYNSEFDLRMMKQSHARFPMRWPSYPGFSAFCIMKLYAQFRGEWNRARGTYRWHSLEAAGAQCGIALPNSHRAQADSFLARAILHHMAESS